MPDLDLRVPLTEREIALLNAAGLDLDDGRVALLENPDLFLLHYFPHRFQQFKPFHLRLIHTATKRRRGLIEYPAAHGKTTIVSTTLPIWQMSRDPDVRIADLAKNEEEAKSIMLAIHAELLGNDRLIADWGPFKPEDPGKPWTLGFFQVHHRRKIAKEHSFAVFGAGARTALGYRTDWSICDDVVTEKNSETPEQRSKLAQWFSQTVMTMGEKFDARLTVVGTRFHPEDLYGDLEDTKRFREEFPDDVFFLQKEDAIESEEEQAPLWPEQWPWQRLMVQKLQMGTLDFNKRFRNIAVDPSRMVFREEHLYGGRVGGETFPGCLDDGYCIGDGQTADMAGFAGFDPAIGRTRHAKFCAWIGLAVGSCPKHERCFWVLDLERLQMTLPQQADMILAKHEDWKLLESRVEGNAYQAGLVDVLKTVMDQRGIAVAIREHLTSRENKTDPEIGVRGMAPWFEQGKVHIPWGDAHSRKRMGQLVDELVQFPSGRTTDTVMAFWFAWLGAKDAAGGMRSFNRIKQPWAAPRRGRFVQNPYYVRG